MKIVKIPLLFNNGDPENITNFHSKSILPCFSKMLECIMYNRLYKQFCEEKLLYSKQFEFTKGYSIDHAIIHFANQVQESFESDSYTLAIFRDLSKAFDTVDRSILLKKLEIYGVNTTNLAWFTGQLNGRKQYIKITEPAETVKRISSVDCRKAQY